MHQASVTGADSVSALGFLDIYWMKLDPRGAYSATELSAIRESAEIALSKLDRLIVGQIKFPDEAIEVHRSKRKQGFLPGMGETVTRGIKI